MSRRAAALVSTTWLRSDASFLAFLSRDEWAPERLPALVDVPVVAVLPFDEGAGALLAARVRRDLNLTWALSARGPEDTHASFEHNLDGADLLLTGVLSDGLLAAELWRPAAAGAELLEILEVRGRDFNELSAQLVLALCQRLGLTPHPRSAARHGAARFTRAAWERAAAARATPGELRQLIGRGAIPPQALLWLENEKAALTRAASLADPFDPQLGFDAYCAHTPGDLREAARALVTALREGPTHGKSQMCMAHLFPRGAGHGRRVLAHARAGLKLLRNNSYAIANLSNYLRAYAPQDPQLDGLVDAAIRLDPLSVFPWMTAVDFHLGRRQPALALEAARRFQALVLAEPLHARTQESLDSMPAWKGDLSKARAHAEQWLTICERALEAAP